MGQPLWWDDPEVAAAIASPRQPLDGTVEADVAIVGGGYTGLWTALMAARREPGIRACLIARWRAVSARASADPAIVALTGRLHPGIDRG